MSRDVMPVALIDGALYDVSIGPATWHETRWSARDQAFLVSDRGGIPWRFVTAIVPRPIPRLGAR